MMDLKSFQESLPLKKQCKANINENKKKTWAQSHSTNPLSTSSIVVIDFLEAEASPLAITGFGLALYVKIKARPVK